MNRYGILAKQSEAQNAAEEHALLTPVLIHAPVHGSRRVDDYNDNDDDDDDDDGDDDDDDCDDN